MRLILKFIVVLAFILACSYALLQTPTVRQYAKDIIREKTGWKADLDTISITLPFNIKLTNVSVEISQGGTIHIAEASCSPSFHEILRGSFVIRSLYFRDVIVNMPQEDNNGSPTLSSSQSNPFIYLCRSFELSDIRVDGFKYNQLDLLDLSLQGHLRCNTERNTFSALAAIRHRSDTPGDTFIAFCLQENEKDLEGAYNIEERNGGALIGSLTGHSIDMLDLQGTFTLPDKQWENIQGNMIAESAAAAFALQGKGNIKLTPARSEVKSFITITHPNGVVSLSFDQGLFEVDGYWDGHDLKGKTQLELQDTLALNDLSLQLGPASLSGSLIFDFTALKLNGKFESRGLDDLVRYYVPLEGPITADLHFEEDRATLNLNGSSNSISGIDIGQSKSIVIIENLFAAPNWNVAIRLHNLKKDRYILDTLDLASHSTSTSHVPYLIKLKQSDSNALLKGIISTDFDSFYTKLQRLEGNIHDSAFEMQKPTEIRFHDHKLSMTPFVCNINDGTLSISLNESKDLYTLHSLFENSSPKFISTASWNSSLSFLTWSMELSNDASENKTSFDIQLKKEQKQNQYDLVLNANDSKDGIASYFWDLPKEIEAYVKLTGKLNTPSIIENAKNFSIPSFKGHSDIYIGSHHIDANLEGPLTLDAESFSVNLDYDVNSSKSLNGTIAFAGPYREPRGQINGKIGTVAQFDSRASLKEGTLNANLNFNALQQKLTGQGNITLSSEGILTATLGSRFVTEEWGTVILDLTTQSPLNKLEGIAEFQTEHLGKIQTHWQALASDYIFTIPAWEQMLNRHKVKLESPWQIKWQNNELLVTPLVLHIDKGILEINGKGNANEINFDIKAQDLPFSYAAAEGRLGIDGKIRGPWEAPQGGLKINIDDMQIVDKFFGKAPRCHASANLILRPHNSLISGDLLCPSIDPITFKASLPLDFSLWPLNLNLDQHGYFEASANATGAIAPILDLFLAHVNTIAGYAKFSMQAKGTLAEPQVSGVFSLSDGLIEDLDTGTIIQKIMIKARADGNKIQLEQISGVDNKSGSINGTGYVLLDSAQHFPFAIDFKLNRLRVLNTDILLAGLTGGLTLKGNSKEATLEGKAEIVNTILYIPEEIPEGTETVDVVYVNVPSGRNMTPSYEKSNTLAYPIHYNLDLTTAKRLQIKGQGLESSWKGNLHITGLLNQPFVKGELKIINGSYKNRGRTFDVNQGTITLAGPLETKTSVYIIASQEIDDITIEAILRGNLKNLSLAFRSNPAMSQQQILSFLLFGKGVTEITPYQGTQLSQSISNLSSKSGPPDLLSKLCDRLYIDRLNISRDPVGGNVTLQVGKYVASGVFVSLNKSVTDDENSMAVEAKVVNNLKLIGEVTDNAETQLLLKWRKDF